MPPTSIGVLQRILNDLYASVQAGGALLHPILMGYVALFGTFALCWVALSIARGGRSLEQAISLVIRLGLVFLLLNRWPWFLGGLRDVALQLGLAATGNTLQLAEFLDPGMLVKAGIDSGAVLWTALQNNLSWRTPIVGAVFLGAWAVYIGAYMVIAYKVFWFQVELLLASLAGLCLVPALAFRFTSFVAAGLFAYAANMLVRFLLTALLAGALWNHLKTLTTLTRPVTGPALAVIDFTMQEAFYASGVAVVLAAAFLSINRLAGVLTSGVPGMGGAEGVSGVLHMVAGGITSLVTAGAGATTVALGGARLGAAGVQGLMGTAGALPSAVTAGSMGAAVRELYAGAQAGMSGGMQARLGELMGTAQRLAERSGAQTLQEFLHVRHGALGDMAHRGVHR